MALKDLLKATKADRYTQDGRDELNKALKADVEDRTYKTGEISQKTGLQKQPDGSWAPPKETKYGKVQQNKEGKWGVQQKLGKGSQFIEHKNEKDASKALANYTAGYNSTERSKQDPHSNEARQAKQWNKETEKIAKGNNAERRAESKPAASKPDTKEQTKALMEKYKDLPGAQKKDALYASTFEGSSIGMTQTSMERNGWDLIQADDDVNVYAKPDGSKVTMKHDGKRITSTEYEAPGSKPAEVSSSDIATNLDEITSSKGGTKNIGGVKVAYVPGNGYRVTHKAPSGTELTTGYDSIEEAQQAVMFRLNRIKKGEIPAISEDSVPRELTGDCKIRVRRK